MKKIKFEKSNILIALLVILLVAGAVGIYLATMQLISTNQEIASTQAEIDLERARFDAYQDVLSQVEQIDSQGDMVQLQSLFPSDEEIIQVIEEIERIAELSNSELVKNLGAVELTEEGLAVPEGANTRGGPVSNQPLKGEGYAIIQITGTLRTTFPDLIRFLQYIEDSRYILNIDNINLSRANIEGGPDVIDARLVINVYVEDIKGLE